MTLKIENIRPDFDYGFDRYDSSNNWSSGILRFNLNGEERFEYLNDNYESALSDLDGRTRKAVKNRLSKWVSDHGDASFTTESDYLDIVAVWHRVDIEEGIEIELTEEAIERLNISGNGYEINSNGVISWEDRDFGYQEIDNGDDGDQEFLTRCYNLANPETALGDIEDRLDQLRDEAEEEAEEEAA